MGRLGLNHSFLTSRSHVLLDDLVLIFLILLCFLFMLTSLFCSLLGEGNDEDYII